MNKKIVAVVGVFLILLMFVSMVSAYTLVISTQKKPSQTIEYKDGSMIRSMPSGYIITYSIDELKKQKEMLILQKASIDKRIIELDKQINSAQATAIDYKP
jgi:hypothetical protein